LICITAAKNGAGTDWKRPEETPAFFVDKSKICSSNVLGTRITKNWKVIDDGYESS
jgi:hypothetical protein